MKATVRRSFARVVLTIVIGLGMIILGMALLGPAAAQASAPLAPQAQAEATDTPPPPPPPLRHPLRTPEPGAKITLPSGSPAINAVPFQPRVRIQPGQSLQLPQGGDKPAKTPTQSTHEMKPGASAHVAPHYSGALVGALGWTPIMTETFEGVFPLDPRWDITDTNPYDGYERFWDDTNIYPPWGGPYPYDGGSWAAWPAAGGFDYLFPTNGYTDNLSTWMTYGPVDLSSMYDVFVSFGLWYDTEPEFDWVYFCISTDSTAASDPPNSYWNCEYWSGRSGGWLDQAYWLTEYAGYSSVTLGWYFYSDGSVSGDYYYSGAFVDAIQFWADDSPPVTPTPDPSGQLIQNGSFEDNGGSLDFWNPISLASLSAADQPAYRPAMPLDDSGAGVSEGEISALAVGVTSTTYVEGAFSAYLYNSGVGSDFLYQPINVPAGVEDVVTDYWFVLSTLEITPGRDYFCASLRENTGSIYDANILVDLGCMDAVDAAGYTAYWQESIFTLSSDEAAAVTGATQPVVIVFELYNTGEPGSGTTLYLDYIQLYATGTGAGATIDPNEPNDDLSTATSGLTCSAPISGTVGDALGGYDIDWFALPGVPAGTLQLDLDSQTLVRDPRSTLDSILRLYDEFGAELAYSDDDGVTLDSFISETVSAGNYYVSVESFSGFGDPTYFYELTALCNSSAPEPVGGNVITPTVNTWTVMLYLNAEDPGFASILTQYRQDIEAFIGSKQAWLNVLLLYDGPDGSDTVLYWVQPNGSYTNDVNRWLSWRGISEYNLGDPETLSDFITWAMDNYPAEKYYLAIDDHGNGTSGISWDSDPTPRNRAQLTPPEVYSAIKEATRNGARKIDIVDFEACLMGLTENAYDLREWANYVVFSEQISWGISTYPVYFSDLAAADSALTVGQRIIDRYSAGATAAEKPHTISLIDTSQLLAVRTAVNNFANALMATSNVTPTITTARNASQAFAADREATNPAFADYIDLWDLAAQASARGLAPTQAAAVQSAVQAAVLAERHVSGGVRSGQSTYQWNHARAHGLSIYYPTDQTSSTFGDYTAQTLYQMTQVDSTGQNGTWDEFLTWVFPVTSVNGHGRGMLASRAELKLTTSTSTYITRNLFLPLIRR